MIYLSSFFSWTKRFLYNKSIGIFDADKKETKHKIASLDEIYAHQEELKQAIQHYLE